VPYKPVPVQSAPSTNAMSTDRAPRAMRDVASIADFRVIAMVLGWEMRCCWNGEARKAGRGAFVPCYGLLWSSLSSSERLFEVGWPLGRQSEWRRWFGASSHIPSLILNGLVPRGIRLMVAQAPIVVGE
jgi:hypothetical protein